MELAKNTKVTFAELPGTDLHKYLLTKRKGSTPVELVGVTTLMGKMGLKESYSGINPDVLARAAARGTAIHELFQAYEMNGTVVGHIEYTWVKENGEQERESEDASKLLEKYGQLSALNFQAVAVEYLVSDNESVASLIDFVSEVDEHTVDLVDYKSSSRLDKEGLSWQLSFYKYFFERQNKGIKVRNLLGVHCHDAKGLKLVKVEYRGDDAVEQMLENYRNGVYDLPEEPTAVTLSELLPEHPDLTAALEKKRQLQALIDQIDVVYAPVMEELKDKMRKEHIFEVNVSDGKYVFTEEHFSQRFDSKKFKAEHPDEYDKYTTTLTISASIKFYKTK